MSQRRAKILGTLGPASSTDEMIGALLDAGLDAVRLNMSHGSHEDHTRVYHRVREQSSIRRKPVAVLGDLQGPKIRVGRIPDPGMELRDGDTLVLIAEADAEIEHGRVTIDYLTLPDEAKIGERVLMDDGALEARITKIEGREVHTRIVVGGVLKARKGVN
ncbi:MAG: pyruvate kinase, partial [Myxococcales bacterium]|nr:pyruvate kinase [Myxococcales bacterium]